MLYGLYYRRPKKLDDQGILSRISWELQKVKLLGQRNNSKLEIINMDLPQLSDRACPYYPAMLTKAKSKADRYNKILDEAKAKGRHLEPTEIIREATPEPLDSEEEEEEEENKTHETQENKETDADRDAEFDLGEIWEKREKIKTFEQKTRTMLRLAHEEMEKLQEVREEQRTTNMKENKRIVEMIESAKRTKDTGRTKDTLFSTTARTDLIPMVNWRTLTREGPHPNGVNTASTEPSTSGKHEQGPGQEI